RSNARCRRCRWFNVRLFGLGLDSWSDLGATTLYRDSISSWVCIRCRPRVAPFRLGVDHLVLNCWQHVDSSVISSCTDGKRDFAASDGRDRDHHSSEPAPPTTISGCPYAVASNMSASCDNSSYARYPDDLSNHLLHCGAA